MASTFFPGMEELEIEWSFGDVVDEFFAASAIEYLIQYEFTCNLTFAEEEGSASGINNKPLTLTKGEDCEVALFVKTGSGDTYDVGAVSASDEETIDDFVITVDDTDGLSIHVQCAPGLDGGVPMKSPTLLVALLTLLSISFLSNGGISKKLLFVSVLAMFAVSAYGDFDECPVSETQIIVALPADVSISDFNIAPGITMICEDRADCMSIVPGPEISSPVDSDDQRCGPSFPDADGLPTFCESSPCCSADGRCGSDSEHCDCEGCLDLGGLDLEDLFDGFDMEEFANGIVIVPDAEEKRETGVFYAGIGLTVAGAIGGIAIALRHRRREYQMVNSLN
eukprot:TRINITY_DN2825_c0_g1_i4.p1 TRINITY_DN2825_c0_g1~~TRINITY_DN2825_c0_g1_i4.p1  ORF type:complete len:338 (+),score=74.44 TRINITY_DN2825_c0_g1_i4:140-1153(+)